MSRTVAVMLCVLLLSRASQAQPPVGTLDGVVRDTTAGVIASATVQARARSTGQTWTTRTGDRGQFGFPNLPPGEYDLTAEAPGFQRFMRTAVVEVGSTTRADLTLPIGDLSDSVRVEAASPQLQHDTPEVSGVIAAQQIQALPLNGRSFVELAKLEPGVQTPSAANRNRVVVPLLGAPASNVIGPRVTIDGGDVSAVGLGGSQMTLSQEDVQEFQVATVNFDVAAGMTAVGVVNVVTRAGGNQPRGSSFYFFRDHNLAAYPVLTRDPRNPDPFFQRQQFGVAAGGPLLRDRVFYFANWERNDQRAVAATTLLAPDFASLSRITPNPFAGDLFSVRLDGRLSDAHTIFARYSADRSRAFGPSATGTGGSPNAYPSNWSRVVNRADQALLGATSVFGPGLVNDVRVSSFRVSSNVAAPGERDCLACLGIGAPAISIPQAGLVLGNSSAIDNRQRRVHLNDTLTWQTGGHRVRLGVDWERSADRNLLWSNDPVTMTLYSPDRVRAHNLVQAQQPIPLPVTFRTLDDILQLPVQSITVGIGEAGVRQEDGSVVRRWNTIWLSAQDAWRVHERLTLTYGLGWGTDGILNHDLHKPQLLAPLLGQDGLGPTRRQWNVSPVAGLVWKTSSNGNTILRAAAGRFHGRQGLTSSMDAERVALGPAGGGRQNIPGSAVLNPVANIPGVPVGTPLEFRGAPTSFTGTTLMASLGAIRADLTRRLGADSRGVQQIQITKQASPAIFPEELPDPSAVHVNAGIQREISTGLVLSADFVFRRFVHVPQNGGSIDVNLFSRAPARGGPVIPRCTAEQVNAPDAQCSNGPINVQKAPFHSTYRGVLVRVDKRLSQGFQLLGSYALSRNTGTSPGNGFNLENWEQNAGPASNDVTHVVNVAGAVRLPRQIDLGFVFSFSSTPPFSAYVGGIDFNGDGTGAAGGGAVSGGGDLLPGTGFNVFNRGVNRADLQRLVAQFNETYAGRTDAQGVPIPRLTLPAGYSFGDTIHSLDLRLSRSFVLGDTVRLTFIVEAFNVYNAANLTGFSGDLTSAAFGQPTGRVTQVYGSSGPRAFQVAARVSF